jgi:exopolysaccharide production protein ExoZ
MRGIAALSVVCGHAVSIRGGMGIPTNIAVGALSVLQSGVDVFFVISGFIIATTACEIAAERGRSGAVEFALRRCFRIFPIYWIVLLAAIASSYWITVGPQNLPPYLTLQQVLLITPANYFVSPAWTLVFEIQFYAAVACVILLIPKYVMEAILCGFVVLILCHLIMGSSIYGLVLGHPLILEFGFGVVVARLTQTGIVRYWPLALFASGAMFAVGGFFDVATQLMTRTLTFGLGSGLLIYATVAAEINGAKFPRPFVYLGAMSYSLYICHHLLLVWMATKTPGILATTPLTIVAWIVTIVAMCAAIYEFIERQLLRWTRGLSGAQMILNGNQLKPTH